MTLDPIKTDRRRTRAAAESAAARRAPVGARRVDRGPSGANLTARGEPFLWTMGGALVLGIFMIAAFLALILWNGIAAFYPRPVQVLALMDGTRLAGEASRHESFRLTAAERQKLPAETRERIGARQETLGRTLFKTGNFDLYNEDFKWVAAYEVRKTETPEEIFYIERVEWGPFIGFIESFAPADAEIRYDADQIRRLVQAHDEARRRRGRIHEIERRQIGAINHALEKERLVLRRIELEKGRESSAYRAAQKASGQRTAELNARYGELQTRADALKARDASHTVTLSDVGGRRKTIRLSEIVRFYPPNAMGLFDKLEVYLSRWMEFLTSEPREANTEGGVMPAIFGTFVMTLLMVLAVAPFGVMAALYLREYARQGRMVSVVRICVNNLAGVPSIVYGVFGLGFFAYLVGGTIDSLLYSERLPNPTFGTGGILWAALTLALLTVPVVIVATEEALAAVPPSLREGSLACGASKWQTIRNIVLPKALPGIMTGLILAMARGAGEVAPLMLIGVVKLAPELPIDSFFPFVHLERSFMHLGFHIFDVGFQSRNSEAGKPMVFVTTLLLIALVALMNATAIYIRNRLKRKYASGHF